MSNSLKLSTALPGDDEIDAQGAPNLFAVDDAEGEDPTPIRPDDAPEVWVYEGDEQPANPDALYLGSE
jgi:hypothetical protein